MLLVCWPANRVAMRRPAISSLLVARPLYTLVYFESMNVYTESSNRNQCTC